VKSKKESGGTLGEGKKGGNYTARWEGFRVMEERSTKSHKEGKKTNFRNNTGTKGGKKKRPAH